MTDARSALDRRAFLKLGAAASGLAIGCGGASPQPEAPSGPVAMRYRGEESKRAITRYKVLKEVKGQALLDVRLETGRKHQIRVHLSNMNCPVVGDKKYGALTNPIRRIALHAYSLSFIHPVSRKRMHFSTPIPRSFEALVG